MNKLKKRIYVYVALPTVLFVEVLKKKKTQTVLFIVYYSFFLRSQAALIGCTPPFPRKNSHYWKIVFVLYIYSNEKDSYLAYINLNVQLLIEFQVKMCKRRIMNNACNL